MGPGTSLEKLYYLLCTVRPSWLYNKSGFWVIPKITFANLCKPLYEIKLFHFDLSFWIWEVWRGRENITKIWISQERKELIQWSKKHFPKFLKGYHLVKNKKFIKNSGHKLNIFLSKLNTCISLKSEQLTL